MASLENGVYEFRNQAGDSTPRGLSNFPNWFNPLVGAGGKPNVRPADLDFALNHKPFWGHEWEGSIIGEFKPSGWGELGYAQSGIIEWCGKMPNSYGLYIEDSEWDIRTKTKYDDEQMTTNYKVTVYKDGKKVVYWKNLIEINESLSQWWDTGTLSF